MLARTNAPRAYDHGGAIELYDGTLAEILADGARREAIERYILVPESALEWQRGRNASGLRSLETEGLLIDERDVTATLWKRLYAETPE